jgi:hypothetical protein
MKSHMVRFQPLMTATSLDMRPEGQHDAVPTTAGHRCHEFVLKKGSDGGVYQLDVQNADSVAAV